MTMFHPVAGRIVQVLKDYLPAELDALDTLLGQPETPDIQDSGYFEYGRRVQIQFPGVRVRHKGMRPIEVRTFLMGELLYAWYLIDVMVDVELSTVADDELALERNLMTYVEGIYRVLCLRYDGLETIADPTRFAFAVELESDVSVGPIESQEGYAVRTGILPLRVRRNEQR